MRTEYQNLRFFNKEGYEIPLAKASNIIVKIYSKNDSEANATILNGVYMNEVNRFDEYVLDNFKILDRGCSFYFDCEEEIVTPNIDDICIDLYIDGELVDASLYRVENDIEFDFISFNIAKTTTMSKNDEEYKKYGINDIKKLTISVTKDIKTNLIFPSFVFTANMELEKVSTGLHSTETIFFGVVEDGELVNIIDDTYDLLFLTDVKDDDVQFFTFDDVEESLQKSHNAYVSLSERDEDFDINNEDFFNDVINIQRYIHMPQCVNFCCISNEEGYHEQKIYVMLVERDNPSNQYKIGEITVVMDVEGEDERFRALFTNFGIPDPITYPTLFKEVDIKEDNINWNIVNRKSKELFLSYSEIFPYVGTYKALINAVKFLGYDDVYFREWYKDIKNNIHISKRINVNEEFNDSISNLTYDDILEDRIYKKKLNKLSLMYKLNKESGEYDEVGTPLVINSYDYNVDEIILKLNSLKEWLERHILALNCRIVDITGEGVVYERVPFKIYGTNMQNFIYEDYLNFSPKVKDKNVTLDNGVANISVTILNDSTDSYFSFDDFNERFGDYEDNIANVKYPYVNNMYVKAFTSCENAKINSSDGYLFINEGEILLERDKNEFIFSKNPIIYLEKGNLKTLDKIEEVTYQEWWNNKKYVVDYDRENSSYYIENKETNEKYDSCDYICLLPIEEDGCYPMIKYTSKFICINSEDIELIDDVVYYRDKYTQKLFPVLDVNNNTITYNGETLYATFAMDENNAYYCVLDAPVFILKDYTVCTYDEKNNFVKFKLRGEYILEILDGKLTINDNENKTTFININYDEDSNEQSIKVNYQYEGYQVNNNLKNSYYNIKVNNIGHYDIVAYALNQNGNIFAKKVTGGCNVINEKPDINITLSIKDSINDNDFYIKDSNGATNYNKIITDSLPLFRPTYMIHNIEFNHKDKCCEYPTFSYAYDTPKTGDYLQFMNICDKFYCSKEEQDVYISLVKSINKFKIGDEVNIVYYDNNYLNGICETVGTIIDIDSSSNLIKIVSEDYDYLAGKYVYIFPITQHKLTDNVIIDEESIQCKVYLDNKNLVGDDVFSVGEMVKVIYTISDGFVVIGNVVYYRDKVTNELYPVYDAEGNTIPYTTETTILVGEDEERTKPIQTFFGASSFRIKDINNEDNSIILDGIFNYKKYIEEKIYYKNENKELKELNILKDGSYYALRLSNKSEFGVIETKLHICKTNQRYVNYVLKCKDSLEFTDDNSINKTRVYFEDSRLIDYIDDTYTFIPMSFDKVNAFDYWYSFDSSNDKLQYTHSNIPVTLRKEDDFIIINDKNNYSNNNYRWRLYKKNIYNQTRELLFEVENRYLSMKMVEEGIYDVELDVFDKFGNKSSKCFDALIKVK